MKLFEIEQKYRLKDPERVRWALKRMGARKIAEGSETNEFFDRGRKLREKRLAMRLRKYGGKAVLTLKGPRLKSKFTKRMEIETPIECATAKEMLHFLGCQIWRQYSKKREVYKLGKTIVTVDFLKKFGWFLEIEGQPRAIGKFEKKLGLRVSDREKRSYLQMMFGWRN